MKKRKWDFFDICNNIFMFLLIFIIAYPLYYTVIVSVSDPVVVAKGGITWRVVDFSLDAYKYILEYKHIWEAYANTIYYTVLGTAFNILLTIPAAYAMSKKHMPGRNVIMTLFLITMYFGGGMVPTYLLVKNLGLLNTRMVLIILGGVSVYNLIVSRVYFSTSIPDSLFEAAEIDGAGEMRKFLSIAVPLAKPIIAVMVLYYAVGRWNSYFDALLYVRDRSLQPLQMAIREALILNEDIVSEVLAQNDVSIEAVHDALNRQQTTYIMKYAIIFISSAPLLAIYPFIQKYFVKGVMIGAVKE